MAQCRRQFPPRLFHKAAFREKEDGIRAEDVRDKIADRAYKIIGVVINAVDDYLLKDDQLDIHWTWERIQFLSSLLYEAKLAQRQVIIISDHGHILEQNTQQQSHQGGERWRFDKSTPTEQELIISGDRVMLSEGDRLIAPWTEKLRYGMKKNGYHGGINPQEMIVPVVIMSPTEVYPRV